MSHGWRTSRWRAPAAAIPAVLGVVLVVALGATGCSLRRRVPDPPAPDPTAKDVEALNRKIAVAAGHARTPGEYSIGPEDLLEITLFDIEDRRGEPRQITVRVGQSGRITLPLVGQVEAGGHSAIELEDRLREHYRAYIHDPQISVFVKEYRSYRVSVVGYVNKPGIYEITGEKTLLEVLGMAGGLGHKGSKTIQLTRQTRKGLRTYYVDLDRLSQEGDMRFNVPLRSGDVVNVPKAGVFYVEGSVKKPGAYRLREAMTVTQAVAAAGGADEKLANLDGTTLFRHLTNGERQAIPVDVGAIRAGKADDLRVAENDVVVVPMSGFKYVADRLLGAVGMGLSFPVLP